MDARLEPHVALNAAGRFGLAALLSFLALALAGCPGKDDEGGGSRSRPPRPPLPAEFLSLDANFTVEKIVASANMPVKLAFAPDGRLFYTELQTGNIRVVQGGALVAAPFATLSVAPGSESGLLGICLSPTFATDGYVYVQCCVPVMGGPPHKQQIIRYTAVGNTGTSPTVIVDNLPWGDVHNAGNIAFGPDGKLYCTIGDVGFPNLAQTDGELAGRLLRYEANGTPASGNPVAGNPEFCRGLRNTFDFCFQPNNGLIFGSENGPNTDDEINLLAAGKNFEWETLPPMTPTSAIGYCVRRYPSVIAPTGIWIHNGQSFPSGYANNIFLCSYDYAEIRRLRMSGPSLADVDSEEVFAALDNSGLANKPLDIVQAPDGSLWFSTFSAIWRIRKY
jgi:glucose/arabinose dehydrogenase